MNDLSKRIAALSPEQRAVFEQRLKQRGLSAPTVQVIPRRAPTDEIPLSFGQERFWFLNQLDPDGPAYNAPSAVKLNGPLNVRALEQSLNEVARRHEILRTTFAGTNEHPVQVVAPSLTIELPIVDLGQVPDHQREAEAMRLALVEFQRPFDLQRGPLVRARLLRLEAHEHMLLVTMHHIITDGWSTELLIAEMTALYAVLAGGQPPEAAHLLEPAVQYADYAIWQRASVQGAVLESQVAYWRKQLAGVPKLLNLPTDRPRPAVPSFRGALASFELEQSLPPALAALSQREGVTLFILMLAAFNVLLHRWSGQDDIVVGSQISGRSRSELSNVMGFFANNLALRTSLADDPTFRELVQRVGATALSAYSHQDVPIELLFQVLFTVQNELVPTREVAGVTMRPLIIDSGTTKLDLTFFIWEGQDRLSGTIEYSTELFDAATIERLVGHYQVLLHAIVADPDRRISTLPLLTETEQRLLRDWNATEQFYPETQPIHDLIAAQAARTPDATAVICEASHHARVQLTYQQLNERANQLAHRLRALGVGAHPGQDALVGLCSESSLDLIVGALGILKAGGAYIPLNPTDSAERLAYIVDDAQLAAVVTQRQWRDRLPSAAMQIIYLDDDHEQPTGNLQSFVADDSIACTIYTSDSTGQPKGVMIPHGGIRNRLLWMQDAYHLTADDRVLQKTPFSFDVSAWELFWPLMVGATLVMARPGGYENADDLVEAIQQQGITTLHCLPSMLQSFLQASNVEHCTSIRRVICSGETLPFELQQRFFARLNAELHNLYGPSAAFGDVTAHDCDPHSTRSIVPIGRPIANTQVYLLDRHLNPVPVGTTGELFIGGVGLSRGYLRRPALTAEMFVPHPFSAGARLYRTGDLARYRPDGTIEFLGRSGQQTADGTSPPLEQAYVAPRTPTEQILALIWAEVLEIERVGIHDNFFDLGGHSLRALLLLSRVRDVFKISLPLQAMFQSTTVAGLATLLIEHEPEPGRIDKIARLLQRIKGVSREELKTTLEQRRQQGRAVNPGAEPGR